MKTITNSGQLLTLLFILSLFLTALPAVSVTNQVKHTDSFSISQKSDKRKKKEKQANSLSDTNVYIMVDEIPHFRNGSPSAWVSRNVQYPLDALQNRIEGKVYVSFIINQDGTVSDIKVIRNVCPSIDLETIRVIESMPKWKPGILHGKPVRVKYTMPINFKLNR